MTLQSETDSYKKWLTFGVTDRAIIQTIEVFQGGTSLIALANWDRAITATIEGAVQKDFLPTRFLLEPSETGDSLDQRTTLVISAYEGQIYDLLNGIPLYDGTPADRRTPLEVVVRLYMHDDLTAMLVSPPPRWAAHAVTATFDAVKVELTAVPLRDRRAGIYYVAREFPILRYL